MPSPRYIFEPQDKPDPTGVQEFFSRLGQQYKDREDQVQIGNIIDEYRAHRNDVNAYEDAQLNLERSNISPTRRLQAQNTLNGIKKTLIANDKSLNQRFNKGMVSAEEKEERYQELLNDGYPPEEAAIYVNSPPGVQQSLERNHRTEKARGIRKSLSQKEPVVNQGVESLKEQEIKPVFVDDSETPQERQDIQKVQVEDWEAPVVPENMTPAEKVKWENNNEKENNKVLKDSQDKKHAYKQNDILINSMTQVNDSKKLPEGIGKLIIDPSTGDIRPTAQLAGLVNPETQLYVKNLKQWLKGAKDFFGARVTNFDVSSFMAQLPSLLNSEQGRRLILKQMKYVNDLEQIHNNTLNEGLKKYGRKANYNQVVDVVDRKVEDREKDLLDKINNLVQASDYINKFQENPEKFKGYVLMQSPDGKYKAVPEDKVESLKSKKWRDF